MDISILITIVLTKKGGHLAFGDPDENRTRITAVKGRCLNRLTNAPFLGSLLKIPKRRPEVAVWELVAAPGFEPGTTRV